jgi:hypothetical protein
MNTAPAATFETVADGFATALTGTIGVRVTDNEGATTIARVTAGVAEYPAGSGIYTKTLTAPSIAGQYTIVWDDGTSYATDDLVVTYTPIVAPTGSLYITRGEMKAAASMGAETYANDDLDRACETVSRAIDEACGAGRRFYQAAETRYYTPDECGYRTGYYWSRYDSRLEIDDLSVCTTLAIDTAGDGSYATTWTENTDFFLEPVNALLDSKPFTEILIRSRSGRYFPSIQRAVKITGTFGWPAVPAQVSQYAQIFAAQLVLRGRQAPFGILMQGMEVGATARLMRVDPDFDRLLGRLVKSRPFV